MINKRKVDVCVLSDLHLGTIGSHPIEVLHYLRTIEPELLILNGDIIDIWNFRKNYFPSSHISVISYIIKLIENGVKVVYITGNHDDALRQFTDIRLGNFMLTDKYLFTIDNKEHWVFHGDVFDNTTKGKAKIIAKLGGKGYDLLILVNRWINRIISIFGFKKMSLSKKVKMKVKGAAKWVSNFEKTAVELAIKHKFDYVICGHIHIPKIEKVTTIEGSTTYLNSGDWVENLTALEYSNKEWTLYKFDPDKYSTKIYDFKHKKEDIKIVNELHGILNFIK